ncbi:hypothetical protein C0J52_09947 [Blattella germanica]|nr:hypothetical protein C0J52_09947 [Blattella germanica]PSN53839.1 hypothetical protein C0J52_09947 [Blattella germanica]
MKAKVVLCLVLVSLATVCSHYGVGIVPATQHPAFPGKCYHEITRKVYAVGERWTVPDTCLSYRCEKRQGLLYIYIDGCSLIYARPPCKVIKNKAAAHPQCCPQLKCPQI